MNHLETFSPEHDFFVGIDSDGCVFDSMEIKHKECFCPNFINRFDLQAGARYAREIWEFVNLYSSTRGINRFKALLRAAELMATHPELVRRDVAPPSFPALGEWVTRENKLGNPQLKEEVTRTGSAELERVLRWSEDVNASVEQIVRNVPPFPGVRETLERLGPDADTVVVSQTPYEALVREWNDNNITSFAALIAGQEHGTKSDHLSAAAGGNRYPSDHILMIGDAPGDRSAARAVNALFYPIVPGHEETSWERLVDEGLERFFSGRFAGQYEDELMDDFVAALPEHPPWGS